MKKRKEIALDFEIDFLTNSIRNVISGDSFQTEILRLTKADLKQITKKSGWNFNWGKELDDNSREVGRNKLYEGVAGNLVAYACKISFQHGFDGYVSFTAKTRLIEHYQKSLNAIPCGEQLMIINTMAANILVDKYFKNG